MFQKKKIVVGPTNMVIYDVPTPIGLPFAFFPLTKKQTSGVIIPTFGERMATTEDIFCKMVVIILPLVIM